MNRLMIAHAVRVVVIMIMAISIAACGYNRDGALERRETDQNRLQANRAGQTDGQTTYDRIVDRDLGTSNANMHDNTNVEMSQALADRIADMPEVDRANVLLTNKNAYIAVMLSDDADDGVNSSRDRRQLGNNREANRDDNRLDNTRMKRYYNQAGDVTTMLKDRITKEVKREAPHILNVYISANPDFGDRVIGFIEQIQAGNPVRGFINEVNTTMERMFPTNNGPNITPDTLPPSTTPETEPDLTPDNYRYYFRD